MSSKDQHPAAASSFSAARIRGFTLVELLVVIGIIALLVSILLPALNKSRQAANQVKCMSNLKAIGTALMLYTNAHKGTLPYGFVENGANMRDGGIYAGESNDWSTLLIQFMHKNAGTGYSSQQTVGTGNAGMRAIFACPQVDTVVRVESFVTHYTGHPRLLPNLAGQDLYQGALGLTRGLKAYKISRIRRSAEVAIIFDGTVNNDAWGTFICAYAMDKRGVSDRKPFMTDAYSMNPLLHADQPVDMTPDPAQGGTAADTNTDSAKNLGNIRFRHNGDSKLNALMVDGHVAVFNYKKSTRTSDLLRRNVFVTP